MATITKISELTSGTVADDLLLLCQNVSEEIGRKVTIADIKAYLNFYNKNEIDNKVTTLQNNIDAKANKTANAYTVLGSFTASSGSHTITSVANYRWIIVEMASVGMVGVIDRYTLRNYFSSSKKCYITSDESWLEFYMSSNTAFRITSTNQATATVTVLGVA